MTSVEECLNLLVETINGCGYTEKVAIALDVAASGIFINFKNQYLFFLEFHLEKKSGYYDLDIKDKTKTEHRILSGDEMVEYYLNLIKNYPSRDIIQKINQIII